MLKLTDQGRKEVSNFVQKCEEFRKELLETGRDTGHIGPPDAETVIFSVNATTKGVHGNINNTSMILNVV